MSWLLTPWHLIQRKSASSASAGRLLSCKTATQNVLCLLGWFGFAALALSWKALTNLAGYAIDGNGDRLVAAMLSRHEKDEFQCLRDGMDRELTTNLALK